MDRRATAAAVGLTPFEQLAFEHMHGLLSFAMHLTRNQADAQDLVQETYLRAYSHFDRYEDGTNFKAWIFTILRNVAYTQLKKQRAQRATVDLDSVKDLLVASESPDLTDHSFTDSDVGAALQRLPEPYRIALTLQNFDGFTCEEIARIMSCPLGTVMTRLFRGRQRLKDDLLAGGEAA